METSLTEKNIVYDIDDVADYVIIQAKGDGEQTPLSNLKLQKLLYYIQAWSLGIRNRIFFEGEFQAWVHGPVNRHIYDRFSNKYLYSEIDLDCCKNKNPTFREEDTEFLNYILDNYLKYSGFELEAMTHKEQPWLEARAGVPFSQRCETVISEQSMRDFYGKQWANA